MSDIVQEHHEIKQSRVTVDPRGFWTKLWDGLQNPWFPAIWSVIGTAIVVLWPAFFMLAILIQAIFWLAVVSKPDVLPIHLPIEAGIPDKNDPRPGQNSGFNNARGSFFLGRIRGKGTEVWLSFKALTQHFLLFGTTGAGKTESIVSYICNYLAVGSAVAFQDAKAAPRAMIQYATFHRIFGRDDDVRVTNYITGLSSARRDPAERTSNDSAVFARNSAEANTQLLVSLMPPSKGENQIFAEKAVALVSATMPGLTDLRDQGILQIDPSVIRRYIGLEMFAELHKSNNISKRSRDALEAFLFSLPGYNRKLPIAEQPEEVARQFGFGQAYFTRSLASLSDTYGHIYLVGQGEIDYQDAVLNGRGLMTLLPSLEKSGEELNNLGKIVLTALRNGMVVGLGTQFEGSVEDMALNLPTNAEIPYGIMNDENAYMLIEGQEMLNAQARGLGFGILTGTQDVSGMMLTLEKSTKQIMSNSAIKQFGYIDDKETTDLAVEFSGEASVLARGRYEYQGDLGTYYATTDASVEKRFRLNATALKKQREGESYILYKGKIHAVQVFNHGISETHKDPRFAWLSHWYSVRMAKVRVPTAEMLDSLLAVSNRPEWRDLKLMISDSARAMLREMTIYFGSMLTIQRMAKQFSENQELLKLGHEVFGARDLLMVKHETPTGLLLDITQNAPQSCDDTFKLLTTIAANHESENSKLVAMGDRAGLDALVLDEPGTRTSSLDDDGNDKSHGGQGSGGGAGSPAQQQLVDPLDDYLSPSPQQYSDFGEPPSYILEDMPGTSSYAGEINAEQPVFDAADESAPLSIIGEAVARNLANMPWMASAVDYSVITSSLVQAESFFEPDPAIAAASVAAGMEELSSKLPYPETQIKSGQDPEEVKRLLKQLTQVL
jgi:hypothetical protein